MILRKKTYFSCSSYVLLKNKEYIVNIKSKGGNKNEKSIAKKK